MEYDGTDSNRMTFIEGLATPGLDLVVGRTTKVAAEELYDGVRVYDTPPFLPNSRIGSTL